MDCGYNNKTKVPDELFPTPKILNKIPCVGSDRYLVSSPEYVEIVSVCQDEYNTSIVYIDFKLNGVYNFTPELYIKKVDDDTTYETKGVTAPLVRSYWRSEPKLIEKDYINTACKTKVYTLAFDFGSVIPNFLGSIEIEFSLNFVGVLPEELDLPDFRSLNKNIEALFSWQKGPLPNPLSLVYDENEEKLTVIFEFESGIPCTCNVQCKTISGNNQFTEYCEDKTTRIVIDYTGGESIDDLLIQFVDSLGNNKHFNIEPVVDLTPNKPSVIYLEGPRRVEISASKTTATGRVLKNPVAYQIWRYQDSINNAKIWKDWSLGSLGTFVDMEVLPGKTYGYAVRFKGQYNDISKLSDWEIART